MDMKHNDHRGFTLVELVMTMVLIGIVAFIVADAMLTGIRAFFVTDYRKEALDNGRIAVERMTREMRNVRSLSDIETANASQFCFINVNGVRISFRYANPNIIREEGGAACPGVAGNTLATNIDAFTFSYIQADGTPDPAPPAKTRMIGINLTSTISGESVQLQSEVYLRNL